MTRIQRSLELATRMGTALAGIVCLLASPCVAQRPGRAPAAPATIALTHVTVIDARSPTPRPDQTVVVGGNRILAVGPSASVTVPAGVTVVDARGKFLIPGLWDMHVHTTMPGGRKVLPLYVANGVTGVRDMADDWSVLTGWRKEIAAGTLIGPRILAAGPYLEGGDVPIPHILISKPEDAQPAVDSLIKLGVDFVKVHSQLNREKYFAIARAARRRGITFVGHVPRDVGAADASDAGQKSIEHLLTVPNQCTPDEVRSLAPRFPIQAALGACTTDDLRPLFAKLKRNGTWVVPTLVAQLEVALWPKRALPGDAYGRYLPDSLKKYVAGIFPMPDSIPPDADVVGKQLFAKRVAVTGALYRAGVGIMPGTDAPLRNSPPGFGLHQELSYFVEAGLTPFEALKTATLDPARFFKMTDSLGTVESGKLADLVLLAANPLENIANARRTVVVIANGRLYDIRRDGAGTFVDIVPRR
jgi:imidazolonepropionase-like amidohydrolase